MVVHGDGIDEIRQLAQPGSQNWTGNRQHQNIPCEDFGLPPAVKSDLLGGGPEENAGIIRGVLEGTQSPARDIRPSQRRGCNISWRKSATVPDGSGTLRGRRFREGTVVLDSLILIRGSSMILDEILTSTSRRVAEMPALTGEFSRVREKAEDAIMATNASYRTKMP